MVLDHTHLLGNDVELLADLDADLDQESAVVRAQTLRFGEFVPNDVAGWIRIERFASAFLANVAGNLDAFGLGAAQNLRPPPFFLYTHTTSCQYVVNAT